MLCFIYSDISGDVVTAGINTDETTSFQPDFPFIVAPCNEWHHMAVVYDSTLDIEAGIYPILRVYVDGIEVPGNMQSDMGIPI